MGNERSLKFKMAVNIIKTTLIVIMCCVLTIVFALGWQTSRQKLQQPRKVVPKYGHGRGNFEQQKSFDILRNFFVDLSPKNLSASVEHGPTISSAQRSDKVYNLSLSEMGNISKPDAGDSDAAVPRRAGKKLASTTLSTEKEECGPPKNHILFFKMHKCSSSTIQNILMRYGDSHDLNFVLPPKGNYLGGGPFTSKGMLKFPVKEYNIFCHHTRFNYKGMSEVMPKNTVWTTIIREPVGMFESTFSYRNLKSAFKIKSPDPLAAFSENPQHYTQEYGHTQVARDPMLFDLGLDNSDKGNIVATRKLISHLDKVFDLVLITEYFEESLILLRDLLCWQTDDIVSFVVNARSKSTVQKVREDVSARLRKWNAGDVMLYDHFNETFWKKVEAYGVEKMRREVDLLRARNEELRDKCIIDPEKTLNQGGIWHPPGIQIQGLVLKEEAENDALCQGMAKAELPFTNYLLQKQKKKYGML